MTSTAGSPDDEVARLADLLETSADLEAALHRVADLAARSVPPADGAGVVVRDLQHAQTVATTDAHVRSLATYQYGQNEGPVIEALRFGEPRRVDDVRGETRWPGFCREADRLGLRAALAVPLRMARSTTGALTLYSRQPQAFDGMSHDLALLFAGQAAVALSNGDLYFTCRRLVDNLNAALESRGVIEQAKGVLIARHACTASEAFATLRARSQESHRKLRDVAAGIVASAGHGQPPPS